MEDLGTRFNFRTTPDIMEKIDDLYKKAGCATRAEFIEKAIIFYCGYLTANDYREYFPNVIVSTMKATLDALEDRMANLLFKNAVAISMMLHVVAATNNIDKDSLSALAGYVCGGCQAAPRHNSPARCREVSERITVVHGKDHPQVAVLEARSESSQ